MDGIVCVDKPKGFTSFDAVAKCRGILGERRMGHTGTLDPMATGVLVLLAGRATGAADYIPDTSKSYTARLRFGAVSDTYDATGKVAETPGAVIPEPGEVACALEKFRGEIRQVPPAYCAVWVDGKRAYDIARKGGEVKLSPRAVTVYDISSRHIGGREYELSVECSKGTYIRSLVHDLGQLLGCGAVLTGLVRTSCCGFTLGDCFTIERLQELRGRNEQHTALMPVSRLFTGLPRLVLSGEDLRRYVNGAVWDEPAADGIYAVYGREFLGLAESRDGKCRSKKLFADPREVAE